MNFQATVKFVIVSVRLILPKVGADGFAGGTTGKLRQTRKSFLSHIKGIKVELAFIAAIFSDF